MSEKNNGLLCKRLNLLTRSFIRAAQTQNAIIPKDITLTIDRNQTSISGIILSHYNQIHTHYNNYFQNYPNSNKLLQNLFKNNTKFFNFCENVHKNNKNTTNNNLSLLLQLPLIHIFKIYNQISDIIH